MNALIDWAVNHARTVLTSLFLILVSGTVSYINIAKEADPDINIPIIYVLMSLEGVSPEDAERLMVRPMEQKLRSIEGIKEMKSRGYEGGASVTLEFDAGFDADQAMLDVREKVDQAKPDLPDDADEPTVNEVNFSLFPVIVVALSGTAPERTLFRLARDLRDKLETITTVLEVNIVGEREEMVEFLLDPVKVESYGLSPIETVNAIRASNLLVPAGSQDTGRGRFQLKVPGLFENLRDIQNMPLTADGDSVALFGDVGEVRRTFKDPVSVAHINGKKAIAIEVVKRTGENIIDTVARVRRTVDEVKSGWPQTLQTQVDINYTNDKSGDIETMLSDLQNNVIAAILLVMVIIVYALGPRTAALVGMAVPGSFLMGILILSAIGVTINIVVLFALILAVGMLVDGAIVTTEFADRKMAEGEPRETAYALAAKRMSWPIIASTATTLAAFLPLVFWPGIVGEFMKFLPLTLLLTLSASLLMALIFIPTLGACFGKPGITADPEQMHKLAGVTPGDITAMGGFTGGYVKVLDRALRHPAKILLATVVLLVAVQLIYSKFGKGIEFFPDVEPDIAQLQIKARGNLSTLEKSGLVNQVEKVVLDLNKNTREFKVVYSRAGSQQNSDLAEDVVGIITLDFTKWDQRRKADIIMADLQKKLSNIGGIIVDRRIEQAGPPVGKPIQIEVSSRFPERIPPAIIEIRAAMKKIGGFDSTEDSRPLPGIDWQVDVDRKQAAKFGASVDAIGRAVQMASTGIKLGEYRPDDADEELDLRIRYPERFRTITQLGNIRTAINGQVVPINNFVTLSAKPKTGIINRVDAKRVMTIRTDVAPGILVDNKVQEIKSWLATTDLPSRVTIKFKGEDEEQKKAEAFLGKAFLVALFIMAVILVTQFNSFYSALLILSAVVMSTIGVFIGLLVTGQPFGIVMGGIGIIALAGIVVNNNIVLIDTFDRLKKTEDTIRLAILKTGAQRLRPVLLTTITTMLGLMPMVLGINIDFIGRSISIGAPATQWWTQISTSIVFGLGFATLLTLVVTPSSLMIRSNVQNWRKKRALEKAA